MDPIEYLKGLDYGRLVDFGYEGTQIMFPMAVLQESIGVDLGVPSVDTIVTGLQLIHDEMRDRGMIEEAHNLWDRLNESTDPPYFGGASYEDLIG